MLLILVGESRRCARLGEDLAKLRQISAWTGGYGADNSDQFWSFSWKKGQVYTSTSSTIPLWTPAASDLVAGSNQAVDILHRVAGREDILAMQTWSPHTGYSHLVLADAFKSELPSLTFVSAADKHRTRWARDPAGFDAGQYQPAPTGTSPGSNAGKRWPYNSSFLLATSFFDQAAVPQQRIFQAATHSTYFVPNGALGPRLQAETAFPSHKAFLHDGHGRHFGTRVPYCVLPEARLPVLFVDGSVSVRAAADANPGWRPGFPTETTPMIFTYVPDAWEPPTLSGAATDPVPAGRFRWTRGTATEHGIAGRDFAGPETCSGQPGCP